MKIKYIICNHCNTPAFSFNNIYPSFCTCRKSGIRGGYVQNTTIGLPEDFTVIESDVENSIENIRNNFIVTIKKDNKGIYLNKFIDKRLKECTDLEIIDLMLDYYEYISENLEHCFDITDIREQEILLQELKFRRFLTRMDRMDRINRKNKSKRRNRDRRKLRSLKSKLEI